MGFAAPTDKGYPILFDACVAYASNGVLNAKIKAGEKVPPYWGLDPDGNSTTDPKLIKEGTRSFIGGHKGFGIAIWAELVTGLLSDGQIIDEPMPDGKLGRPSHTILCIDAAGLIGKERLASRTAAMIDRMTMRAPGLTIPGQRSDANKKELLNKGGMELSDDLVERLNSICKQLELPTIY
jgi:LDH2 family malate/lactate/ureidoglycolate dehydrogenase